MKRHGMKMLISTVAAASLLFSACGAEPERGTPDKPVTYGTIGSPYQSECLGNPPPEAPAPAPATVELVLEGNDLTVIDHATEFNCCMQVAMVVSTLTAGRIEIVEKEVGGDPCDCLCMYELSLLIRDLLAGEYAVEVYHAAVNPQTLVFSGMITVQGEEPPRCADDGDCAAGYVCESVDSGACSIEARRCVPGCRDDSDCAAGYLCDIVLCDTCPCPGICRAE